MLKDSRTLVEETKAAHPDWRDLDQAIVRRKDEILKRHSFRSWFYPIWLRLTSCRLLVVELAARKLVEEIIRRKFNSAADELGLDFDRHMRL